MDNFASNKVLLMIVLVIAVSQLAYCNDSKSFNIEESRTFGHHFMKRISFALIPTAFVVGMVVTLLGALTVISTKSLGVGIVLLVLTIGQMIARGLPGSFPVATAFSAPVQPAPVPFVYKDWK